MKRWTWVLAGWISAGATLATQAAAPTYAIDWFTIDGGGGTSTGGVYRLSGTIGQPDAGVMIGGGFTLVGGFWGVVSVVQTPGAPKLRVVQSGLAGTVTVAWPLPATGFRLEQATDLNSVPASWEPVPFPYQTNATDIFITVRLPAANRFYRLSD